MTFSCFVLASMELAADSSTHQTIPGVDWFAEIQNGGIVMIFLGLLSILAVSIILERAFSLRSKNFIDTTDVAQVDELWSQSPPALPDTEKKQYASVLAGLIALLKGIHAKNPEVESVSREASDFIGISLKREMQKNYRLAIIATLSPLLGLLGTVIGMVEAFHIIEQLGENINPAVFASSIGKALITTAVGLVVSIPALGFYHYFRNQITSYGIALDEVGTHLIRNQFTKK